MNKLQILVFIAFFYDCKSVPTFIEMGFVHCMFIGHASLTCIFFFFAFYCFCLFFEAGKCHLCLNYVLNYLFISAD